MNRSSRRTDTADSVSRIFQDTFELRESTAGSVLGKLIHAARLHLNTEVAFISEFVGDRRVFRYVDQAGNGQLLEVGDGGCRDESYCQRVTDGDLPGLIRNAQEEEAARVLPATQELGIGAHISVPIRLNDGRVYGTFCCFSREPDYSLTRRDIDFLQVLADISATLLEKEAARVTVAREQQDRIEALLRTNQFFMVWQPIVDLESGRAVGAESLARFPAGIHDSPIGWFQDASACGMAGELERSAFKNALAALRQLPPDLYVSVNATSEGILDEGVLGMLEPFPLDRIVLEITEHSLVSDYERLFNTLAPLRRRGLRLAVDDAGAGYSSLQHILRLRPNMVKLDMSLTRAIDTDVVRQSLATALTQFARSIESVLVAEGIETAAELATLKSLGVTYGQGFYLHRPMPLDELQAVTKEVPRKRP